MLRIGQIEPTATSEGKYTDGSVAGGIAATRLRGAALNALQEELAHIVEEAGLSLDVNDMTQVLTGLRKLFLSRTNPFADIKADGVEAVASALSNLGLGNTMTKAAGAMQKSANGSDIASVAAFLGNLGLLQGALGTTGWRKNADGTIDQWGSGQVASNGQAKIIFPVPFAQAVYHVDALISSSAVTVANGLSYYPPTLIEMTMFGSTPSGSAAAGAGFNWRAFGK